MWWKKKNETARNTTSVTCKVSSYILRNVIVIIVVAIKIEKNIRYLKYSALEIYFVHTKTETVK